jgi:hypothetical protein
MHRAQLDPLRPHFQPLKAARYYAQRLVTNPTRRLQVAKLLASRVTRTVGRPPAPLAGFETDGVQRLEQKGLLALGPLLTAPQLAEIRDYVARLVPERVGGNGSVQDYSVASIMACPHLPELAMSGTVMRLVGAYLGCVPTIAMLGLRRSLPGAAGIDGGRLFHRDVDTWRSCKLFVYLTDVNADDGPHIYVEETHHRTGDTRIRMNESFEGEERAVAVTGPAGFGFLADTFGVHRGLPPKKGERLMVQFQYATGPIDLYDYPHTDRLPGDSDVLSAWTRRLF